jgi:hypothetical protein
VGVMPVKGLIMYEKGREECTFDAIHTTGHRCESEEELNVKQGGRACAAPGLFDPGRLPCWI